MYRRYVKRLLDIILSAVGTVVLSPLFLIIAAAIKIEDPGPVFFRQKRIGIHKTTFNIMKFRSMRVDTPRDMPTHLLNDPQRWITKIGGFLRKTSLDELPQILQILSGKMSIVGPRPERPEIAAQYEKEMPAFSLRLQVKAGLTGTAQVYGRYNTEPRDKLKMDLMYINKMSLAEDLKLIFATIKILLMKESTQGIEQGQTTAEKTEKAVEKSA